MIVSIAQIKREAFAAARAGQSPNDACSYPFDSAAGIEWKKAFNAERAIIDAENARDAYTAAIAESSCIN